MAASEIERLVRARIPDAEVTIQDLAGDGDHYKATVIAESFRGKSRVQQHQIAWQAVRFGAANRGAEALRPPDSNDYAVRPIGSFRNRILR